MGPLAGNDAMLQVVPEAAANETAAEVTAPPLLCCWGGSAAAAAALAAARAAALLSAAFPVLEEGAAEATAALVPLLVRPLTPRGCAAAVGAEVTAAAAAVGGATGLGNRTAPTRFPLREADPPEKDAASAASHSRRNFLKSARAARASSAGSCSPSWSGR